MHLTSSEIKQEVAIIAINKMMTSNFFSICALDRASEVLQINIHGEAYTALNALHCVDFKDMSPALRQSIPHLIAECFNRPDIFQFQLPSQRVVLETANPAAVVEVVGQPVNNSKRGLMQRLLGKD
jgi:hypothetical protein